MKCSNIEPVDNLSVEEIAGLLAGGDAVQFAKDWAEKYANQKKKVRSEVSKKLWQDLEYRTKTRASLIWTFSDPEVLRRQIDGLEKYFDTPEGQLHLKHFREAGVSREALEKKRRSMSARINTDLTLKQTLISRLRSLPRRPLKPIIDLRGKPFGRLTVRNLDPERRLLPSGQNHIYWSCLCECGNIVSVDAYKLIYGTTRSCGCLRRESVGRSIAAYNETVKGESLHGTFGFLTVLERCLEGASHRMWLCRCVCGNLAIVGGSDLRRGKVKSCGCLLRSRAKGPAEGFRFKGVCVDKATGKFKAFLGIDGRTVQSERFKDEASAALAFDRMCLERLNDRAYLNFPLFSSLHSFWYPRGRKAIAE